MNNKNTNEYVKNLSVSSKLNDVTGAKWIDSYDESIYGSEYILTIA